MKKKSDVLILFFLILQYAIDPSIEMDGAGSSRDPVENRSPEECLKATEKEMVNFLHNIINHVQYEPNSPIILEKRSEASHEWDQLIAKHNIYRKMVDMSLPDEKLLTTEIVVGFNGGKRVVKLKHKDGKPTTLNWSFDDLNSTSAGHTPEHGHHR